MNIRVTDEAWMNSVDWANARAADLAKPLGPNAPMPRRLNLEFVSVNPNGPITVGSGRGAAFGSTLANVLETVGHEVHREYYINDGTNSEQMRLFAESVRSLIEGLPLPEQGYKGDYVHDVAAAISDEGSVATKRSLDDYQQISQAAMLKSQQRDLALFSTEFQTWFSEQSLHDSGIVDQSIAHLIANGAADEEPVRRKLKLAKGGKIEEVEVEVQPGEEEEEATGAGHLAPGIGSDAQDPKPEAPANRSTLWLRSTKFGDDMDRVLRRMDGRLTYIASDVAYHKDKFNRPANADKLITILGPDHHGYISRLHAVLAALELEEDKSFTSYRPYFNEDSLDENDAKIYDSKEERDACRAALEKARNELEVIIFQIVRFVKDGKPSPMRKRDGNIYSLRDLMVEIGKDAAPNATPEQQIVTGKDVARFFYLMRSHDTHMDFDIDLATKGTDENPVFYVQYAHARVCSILRRAGGIDNLRLTIDDSPNHGQDSAFQEATAALPQSSIVNRQSPIHELHPKESALIKKVLDLPWEVQRCAEDYGVHRLTTYAIDLARTFHHFYDACRVIQPEEPELTQRRLAICEATRHALRGALTILGVSAPEKMERQEPPEASGMATS